MMMKSPSDLAGVIKVVFEEAIELGFGAVACDLVIFDKVSRGANFWISGDLNQEVIQLYVPEMKLKHYQEGLEAWKRRRKIRAVELKGRSLTAYMNRFITVFPKEKKFLKVVQHLRQLKSIHHTEAYMKFGFFRVAGDRFLNRDEEKILKRFALVFEQTYTRFLDLQKAEQQAREAQMEATLERIRAASMAMQHSDELPKVALQFLTQLELLDVPIIGSTINIVNEEKQTAISYFADNTKKNDPQLLSTIEFKIKNYELPQKVTREIYKGVNEFTIEAKGKQITKWIEWIKETLSVERAARLEKSGFKKMFFHSIQIYNSSSLTLSSLLPLSAEHWTTLRRMANTFVLSYQRFLDLQKAETQAREARIEASLERVRARAMAMHKSDEFQEVAQVMMNELRHLEVGEEFSRTYIGLVDEEKGDLEMWATPLIGNKILPPFRFSLLINEEWRSFYESYRDTKKEERKLHHFTIPYEGDSRAFLFEFAVETGLATSEEIQLLEETDHDIWYDNIAWFGYGQIVCAGLRTLSEHEFEILQLFSKVFEQTYTRFLDLQKAEAQAREAEIEAALEKMRARTMVMEKSQDLQQIATDLFHILLDLGFEQVVSGGFLLPNEEEGIQKCWFSDDDELLKVFDLPYSGDPVLDERIPCWQNQIPFLEQTLSPKKA